jgi:hypothetical protein
MGSWVSNEDIEGTIAGRVSDLLPAEMRPIIVPRESTDVEVTATIGKINLRL